MYTYVPFMFMILLSTMNTNYAKLCILFCIGKLNQPWHIIVDNICTSSPKGWEVSNHGNVYNLSVWLWSSQKQSKETKLERSIKKIKICGFWWTNYIWLGKAQHILLLP
jgi:hypothetical protein